MSITPAKRYRKTCAGKIKPLKNKALSCHFQVKRKAMASRGRWRTPQRGRAAERTGTPRHAGATAFRQYRTMRGKPERANNRAPEKPANLGHKPLAARFPHRYAQTCPPGYPQGSAENTARLASA